MRIAIKRSLNKIVVLACGACANCAAFPIGFGYAQPAALSVVALRRSIRRRLSGASLAHFPSSILLAASVARGRAVNP